MKYINAVLQVIEDLQGLWSGILIMIVAVMGMALAVYAWINVLFFSPHLWH